MLNTENYVFYIFTLIIIKLHIIQNKQSLKNRQHNILFFTTIINYLNNMFKKYVKNIYSNNIIQKKDINMFKK